ncbi:MAG: YbaK/EbsC family protein [Planctomycetes bacterium]|jgi:Ala-tRNA(Pro) deacylase|nr:YbaK/EbsC family protein [Planctomycetota bacterium]
MPKKDKLPEKLKAYLDKAGVNYDILEHRTVYTAFDAAATMKKKLSEVAKSLLVKADRDYFLVLVPADNNIDFKKLGTCIGMQTGKKIKVVKIPGEQIMAELLKVKAGAMSAFGGFHKLPVVVDKALFKAKKAIFSSGSFNHSVVMAVKDFINLEKAGQGSFGVKKRIKIVKKPKVKKAKIMKNTKKTNKKVAKKGKK